MCIFFFGSKSTPYVSFGFIAVQNFAGFAGQRWVDLDQPFGDIFMYRTFADAKFFCGLSNCCIFFYDVICDFQRPFFNISFQTTSPAMSFLYLMKHRKKKNRLHSSVVTFIIKKMLG